MKRLSRLTIAAILLASPIFTRANEIFTRANEPRTPAPSFALKDSVNKPVSLASLKGKVVLLDFWATWCGGCKEEMPWFMELADKYKTQGLVPVGVAMDEEGWKTVRPYLAEHPVNYTIVTGDTAIAKAYDVVALPITVLIDRDGNIAATHAGVVEKEAFEKEVQALLNERR